MNKTKTLTPVKTITTAPLLPVALATNQYQAAALVIIAAALQTIADQACPEPVEEERADVTPTQT